MIALVGVLGRERLTDANGILCTFVYTHPAIPAAVHHLLGKIFGVSKLSTLLSE